MAEKCSWDSIPNSGSADSSDFLKLQSGRSYKLRPLFEPVKFYKYFHKHEGKLRTAICADPSTCPVLQKHPELKKPAERLAAYVIDREDGSVKILEAPKSVFRPIGASLEMTGKNPGGGKDGSDWYVKVTGKGLNTNYDVGFITHTPLTEEERQKIKEAMGGDKDRLKTIFKPSTPEEIEAKLFGDEDDLEAAKSGKSSSSPVEEPVDDVIDDDFENEW